MAELKTKKTKASVSGFINAIADPERRRDCRTLAALMKKVSGDSGAMWGESIVGYGTYHYTYASGREGDWFLVGFSPRKQNLTIYLMCGLTSPLIKKLGPVSGGKSCLYVKRLSDIDLGVLEQLLRQAVADGKAKNRP